MGQIMKVRTRKTGRSTRLRSSISHLLGVLSLGLSCMLSSCSPSTPEVDLSNLSLPDMCGSGSDLPAGPTCGAMMLCMVGCGLNRLSCNISCANGVDATQALKAITLGVCAAENCAAGDMGGGIYGILGCLLKSCPAEVAACDGLPHF